MKQIVYVVNYHTTQGIRYAIQTTERKAKEFGYRKLAKTGKNFTIRSMTWAEAIRL